MPQQRAGPICLAVVTAVTITLLLAGWPAQTRGGLVSVELAPVPDGPGFADRAHTSSDLGDPSMTSPALAGWTGTFSLAVFDRSPPEQARDLLDPSPTTAASLVGDHPSAQAAVLTLLDGAPLRLIPHLDHPNPQPAHLRDELFDGVMRSGNRPVRDLWELPPLDDTILPRISQVGVASRLGLVSGTRSLILATTAY